MSKVERNEFVVNCTPEQAFDFLSDLRNEPTWNPDLCQFVEKVSEGPIGEGTRYRAKWKGSPQIEVEYVHFDRPRAWRAYSGGSMETKFQCTVEPHEDGAKVVSELELIPHGFFRFLFPVFEWFFNQAADDGLVDRLKQAVHDHYADSKASA